MSDCQNCYNGCTEIVSDRCVKYTGIAVPELGISNGDTLSYVEQSLTTYLVSTLNGTGIKIDLTDIDICNIVQNYLPSFGDITIVHISKALIQAVCDIETQISGILSTVSSIDGPYEVDCLEGVTSTSGIHSILQVVINKLCTIEVDLTALALDLETNYVRINQLDELIQSYLDSVSTSTLIKNRMVPYAVVEYYGSLANFSGTGAGIGDWENIYLCNGQNGTPDKRGVVAVGVTNVPGGLGYNVAVDPSLGNPNYTLGGILGSNKVTLTTAQLPAHSHPGTTSNTVLNPSTHSHLMVGNNDLSSLTSTSPIAQGHSTDGNLGYALVGSSLTATLGKTSDVTITAASTVTVASEGGGDSHLNYQPGLGCYYIQYRP